MPIPSESYIDVPCKSLSPFTYEKGEKTDVYTLNLNDLSDERVHIDDEKQSSPTHK